MQASTQFQNIDSQYRLVDLELFKSSLLRLQHEDSHHSISQHPEAEDELHLPITNSLSSHSQDSLRNLEFATQQTNSTYIGAQKVELIPAQQVVLEYQKQIILSRDRCSNSRFQPLAKQQDALVSSLENLSKQRIKYKEAHYFAKKQRTVQQQSIEDIFQRYNNTPKQPRNQQNDVRAESAQHPLIPQPNHKNEQLDDISDSLIGTQHRIKTINQSPSKQAKTYHFQDLQNIDTAQIRAVPVREQYFEEGRLRNQYLKDAQNKSKKIKQELQMLKYPTYVHQTMPNSSSRKKIFVTNPILQIDQTGQKQSPKSSSLWNQLSEIKGKPKLHHSIFFQNNRSGSESCRHKEQPLDFNYIKQTLIDTRIKIFKSKDRRLVSPRENSSRSHKITNNLRHSPKQSIPKIHLFFNRIMTSQVREWFNNHEGQIMKQCQKIYSYELIARYISQSEIEARLWQFVSSMIEPKRWILLMVDGVYARLKDRYLPN